jgi:hypothetical protein
MCAACGSYKGREIIDVLSKTTKRMKKRAKHNEAHAASSKNEGKDTEEKKDSERKPKALLKK